MNITKSLIFDLSCIGVAILLYIFGRFICRFKLDEGVELLLVSIVSLLITTAILVLTVRFMVYLCFLYEFLFLK